MIEIYQKTNISKKPSSERSPSKGLNECAKSLNRRLNGLRDFADYRKKMDSTLKVESIYIFSIHPMTRKSSDE